MLCYVRRVAICPLMLLLAAGCSSSEPPQTESVTTPADLPRGEQPADPKPEPQPDPAAERAERLARIEAHVERDEWDDAQPLLAGLEDSDDMEELDDAQQQQLADLKGRLAQAMEAGAEQQRVEKLALAREELDRGRYEQATRALNDVLKLAPTAGQRRQAADMADEIEQRRSAQRRLGTWMQLLGSSNRQEVRTAQSQLSKEPDSALPLVLEAIQNEEKPVLVANALELLRRLNRPEAALSAMLGVLSRPAQRQNWPDAVREIGRFGRPGAGEDLLALAVSATDAEQRATVLSALAAVVDPPPQTLVALLPTMHQDGPALPAALQAAHHAVRVHRQFDLTARRGLDGELDESDEQLLNSLPERLAALIEADGETAAAARVLAAATGYWTPQPLEEVRVLSFSAESEAGRAAAVLDGVWDVTEPSAMWRHPVDQRSTLVLDLGEERTVTGVRIWNFNEPGGTHRGWKEADIYVSDSPTALTPLAGGIVPPAPGAADTPDYSTLVPVPATRGRYVTLQARSLWRPDAYTGLTEVQVLGF